MAVIYIMVCLSQISERTFRLPPEKIHVSENQENKSNPKFLHLISEIVVSGGRLSTQVL